MTNEQAANAVANNCATVLKHAVARKCRYLPLEVLSTLDFKLRYPEISMDDSQSSNHNLPCVLSEDNPLKSDVIDDNSYEDCDDEIEESQMNDDSFTAYCTPLMSLGKSSEGTDVKTAKLKGSSKENDEIDDNDSDSDINCEITKTDDENFIENSTGCGLLFTENDVGLIPSFLDSNEIFVKENNIEDNRSVSSDSAKLEQTGNGEVKNTESREGKVGSGGISDVSLNDDFDLGDSFISFSSLSSSKKRKLDEEIVEIKAISRPVLSSETAVIKSCLNSIKKIKINKSNTIKIKSKNFITKKFKR